jgi:hypothetical protein
MNDDFEVTRRQFLQAGGNAFVMSIILGTGMAPLAKPAFAGQLSVLSDAEAATLLAMSRTLFPHDNVADGYYMNVVAAIDGKCSDAAMKDKIQAGIKRLDGATSKSFAASSEGTRVNILKTMEKSDFFQTVYGETVNGLYGNPEIWKMMGYEGPSAEHGGYIERGFDDISWLPKS